MSLYQLTQSTMAGKEASFQLLAQIFSVSRAIQPTSRRSICPQCRTLLSLQPLCSFHRALPTGLPLRQYTTTSTLYKKSSSSSKSSRKSPSVDTLRHTNDTHIPDNAATRNRDSEIDPYDFSELNAGIAKAVARLKDALIKTKDAGRVTPEMIEQLPVELNVKGKETHGGSAHKETTKVGDIASVVQKGGRMVNVFCAEEAVCIFLPLNASCLLTPPIVACQTHHLRPTSFALQPGSASTLRSQQSTPNHCSCPAHHSRNPRPGPHGSEESVRSRGARCADCKR